MERRKKKKKKPSKRKTYTFPPSFFRQTVKEKFFPSPLHSRQLFSHLSAYSRSAEKKEQRLSYYLVHQTQLNREIPKAHSQGGHAETEPLEELNHPCEADLFFIQPPWEASARLTTRGMGPNSTSPLPTSSAELLQAAQPAGSWDLNILHCQRTEQHLPARHLAVCGASGCVLCVCLGICVQKYSAFF